MQQVIQFLSELNKNNNRDWFNQNRKVYEECRDKVLFYTELFNNEIRKFDKTIPVIDPKACLFRIFRDVRFSKDKRPYKTNMGSFIAKGGRKGTGAGYYFHIEPEASFVGGGLYMPQPEPLKAIRTQIYQNPDELLDIIQDKNFKKYFTEFYDHKLKTAPKGFPKDFEHIALLRHKSYAFGFQMDDEVVSGDDFVNTTVDAFGELYKLNRYINTALENIL